MIQEKDLHRVGVRTPPSTTEVRLGSMKIHLHWSVDVLCHFFKAEPLVEVYPETTSGSKEAKKGKGLAGYLPFPSPQSTTAVSLRLIPFAPTTEQGPWLVEANFLA